MRNQNIYTSRITGGLVVGSPSNQKTLSSSAAAQLRRVRTERDGHSPSPSACGSSRSRWAVARRSISSGRAPLTSIDMAVPARSTAVRTVYVTSSDPNAKVNVDVSEIAAVGGGRRDGRARGLDHPQPGHRQSRHRQPRYRQPRHRQSRHRQQGSPQSGHRQPRYRQPGHRQPGHRQPRHRQSGHRQPDDRQPGYRQSGHRQPGHRQPGHRQSRTSTTRTSTTRTSTTRR